MFNWSRLPIQPFNCDEQALFLGAYFLTRAGKLKLPRERTDWHPNDWTEIDSWTYTSVNETEMFRAVRLRDFYSLGIVYGYMDNERAGINWSRAVGTVSRVDVQHDRDMRNLWGELEDHPYFKQQKRR